MQETSNILHYLFGASGVVKAVMFLLLAASIVSWTLILQRAWFFNQKSRDYEQFKARFWGCSDLKALYQEVDANVELRFGLAAIFHAGFKAFLREQKQGKVTLEPIQRVMQIAHAKENA